MADGYQSRGPSVFIVSVVFHTLATIFVALRVSSRIAIVRKTSWDDYVMVFAWLLAFGLTFTVCYGTSVGLGKHQYDVLPEWDRPLKTTEYVFSVLYNPALMATKTSILLFYLKLSANEKIFRYCCFGTLFIVNAAGLALTMLNVFQCREVGAVLETPIPDGARCENIITLYLSSAPVNIITDLAIFFLPMPILTGMRLPRRQKLILLVTFGVGFFVAIIDVIRIAYLQDAATSRLEALQSNSDNASGTGQRNATDVSWYTSLTYMWSAVEVNIGIMCGCVPSLKPIVSRFMPQMLRDINLRNLSQTKSRQNSEKIDSMDAEAPRQIGSLNEATFHHNKNAMDNVDSSHSDGSHVGPLEPIETEEPREREESMDFAEFLTTPDMNELPHRTQTMQTARTATTLQTHDDQGAFFDFVNMQNKKSFVQMTVRESLFPNVMVTVLFVVWGIAYGFLDSLNGQFQRAASMTPWQSRGIHCAYFGGYFFAPLTFGRLCLKHLGFKACYIVGLCIYACGVLIFWPSAVLTSFPAFLVSNFIVGMGLSTLEISANPFVALCGPQQYMELRLNLSQAVQAIASVVSPLLAQRVLFKSATSASSLVDVQWTYLGIALFVVLLAVGFYYVPLPEATDDELERAQGDREDYANRAVIAGRIRVLWVSLGLGVLSMWCYVGAQEAISTTFGSYVATTFNTTMITGSWSAVAHTCFAAGRFLAAALSYYFKSRHLLLFFYLGAIAFSAAAMRVSGVSAQTVIMLLYLFEGPMFSLIFATSLRGLGRHTKDGAALLTAAISGGAALAPISYAVGSSGNRTYQYAYCVPIAAFAGAILLPIWQNAQPMARKLADPLPPDDNPAHAGTGRSSGHRRQRSSKSFMDSLKHRRRKDDVQQVEHVAEPSFVRTGSA